MDPENDGVAMGERLQKYLDHLATFQEGRGVERQNYTFMTLMSSVFTLVGHAINALTALVIALIPVTDIVLHLARFTLESAVDIVNTPCSQDCFIKKSCEPLGPVYLLRTVRDQITQFQEKRGINPEENNFLNVLSVMVTQAGQAIYAVFTMFLALIPAATILLHVAHFFIDRILDIVTTRQQKDLITKILIFLLQLVVISLGIKFMMSSIFSPIFSMQTTIISKIFLLDGGSDKSPKIIQHDTSCGTFQHYICKPPVAVVIQPKPSITQVDTLRQLFASIVAWPAFFVPTFR